MKSKRIAIGSALLAFAMMAAGAMAQSEAAQAPPKHDHIAYLQTVLDLSDAQVAQIRQIHAANRSEAQSNRSQMKALHEQLRTLITSDNFDEAKAQSVISQINQLQGSEMLEHAKTMNAVYKVLNPQQKEKAVKLFGEMGMGAMHGHGPGGPGGDAPPPPAEQ